MYNLVIKKIELLLSYLTPEFSDLLLDKLNVWLHNLTKFSEEITRFYTAEIITALEYLHKEMRTSYQ